MGFPGFRLLLLLLQVSQSVLVLMYVQSVPRYEAHLLQHFLDKLPVYLEVAGRFTSGGGGWVNKVLPVLPSLLVCDGSTVRRRKEKGQSRVEGERRSPIRATPVEDKIASRICVNDGSIHDVGRDDYRGVGRGERTSYYLTILRDPCSTTQTSD